MKIQVLVKSKRDESVIDLVATPNDTIQSVKERIATINNTVPALLCSIAFNGRTLANTDCVGESGIKNGSIINLVADTEHTMLVEQLSDLLQTRDLTLNELDFMYNYKYGSNVKDVLQVLGYDGGLADFARERKEFFFADGIVKVAAANDTAAKQLPLMEKMLVLISVTLFASQKPCCVDDELPLKLLIDSRDTVASIKERAAAAELIPFRSNDLVFGGISLTDDQAIATVGVEDGAQLVLQVQAHEAEFHRQLSALLKARPSSARELSLRYAYRHGATVQRAMQLLSISEKFPDYMLKQTCFSCNGGFFFISDAAVA